MTENEKETQVVRLVTLSDLPYETFHTLSYEEQLVVVQNTMIALQGTHCNMQVLTKDEVDVSETRAVSLLLRPDLGGPFASTLLENTYIWQSYISDRSQAVLDAFRLAVKKGLWEKYLGMLYYDPRLMGEVIHTVSLITEAYTKHPKSYRTLSPGNFVPSYKSIVESKISYIPKDVLFVGGFSIKSIGDIWGIGKYILNGVKPLVIDIEGVMTVEAAKHYRINFVKSDGLQTCLPGESMDLIFTNNLIQSLEYGETDYNIESLRNARQRFYVESAKVLRPGGCVGFVEKPLLENTADFFNKKLVKREIDLVNIQLKEAGFVEIEITDAPVIKDRKHVEDFLRTGNIGSESIGIYRKGVQRSLLISARKKGG